jgi:hypothetical protein
MDLKPTPANEIALNEEVVSLPAAKTHGGTPVNVLVRSVSIPVLVPIIQGLPDDVGQVAENEARTAKDSARRVLEWYGPARDLAKHGVSEQFYFDEKEEGKASYDMLTLPDQAAIFAAILRVSGWSGEQTRDLRRFHPSDGGGGSMGERPSDGMSDDDTAEPEDRPWPRVVGGGSTKA